MLSVLLLFLFCAVLLGFGDLFFPFVCFKIKHVGERHGSCSQGCSSKVTGDPMLTKRPWERTALMNVLAVNSGKRGNCFSLVRRVKVSQKITGTQELSG